MISGHATTQTGVHARVKATSAVSSSLSRTSLIFCKLDVPRSLFCSVFLQYLAQQYSDSYTMFPGVVPKQTRNCNSAMAGLTTGLKSPAASALKWSVAWFPLEKQHFLYQFQIKKQSPGGPNPLAQPPDLHWLIVGAQHGQVNTSPFL